MAAEFNREQLNKLDKSSLLAIIEKQSEQLNKQTEQINKLSAETKRLNDTIQKILEQLVLQKNHRFGRSSEKLDDPYQISFMEVEGKIVFFNEAEAVCDMDEAECEAEEKVIRKAKVKGKRDKDFEGLTVNVIPHYLSEETLDEKFGKNGWRQLKDEVSRKYHFKPAEISVNEHHIGKYVSKEDGSIIYAPHPKWLLPSSPVSPSIAAAVMNAKYVNAVPLYRMQKEFERYGLDISRRTMANWMIRLSEEYLSVMYEHMHSLLYNYHVIQADETPLLVNHDDRPANTKSYMWVYRTGFMYDKPIVLYEYQKTRNASHPREFLKDYSGICVTDGYQVYHTLDKQKEDLRIAGCWTHARRKFNDALKLIPKSAQSGTITYLIMKQIQAIYREEGKLKELSSEERLMQRQAVIKPLVDALFVYLKNKHADVAVKDKLGEAFNYALNQEKYLRVFLEDGDVPMDNNASERAIRGFCIGKKNWVMIDTISGAKASAVIYSIAETAKANDLKPYDYFEHLLTEIPKLIDKPTSEAKPYLDKLLPWSADLPETIRKPKKP